MVLARHILTGLLCVLFLPHGISQQILINEVMSSNQQYLRDADGDTPDWIELWNKGNTPVNLEGYSINDDPDTASAWEFPAVTLNPDQYMLLFASGKNLITAPEHWQTIIAEGDTWKYTIPDSEINSTWRTTGFDDSAWSDGNSGIRYGDNDDNTTVPNGTISFYMRKTFTIIKKEDIINAFLHIDYDDSFVAYINGTEIARANISSDGPPAYDAFANNANHEALMYTGGRPNEFEISDIASLLVNGENVLAIQVHNAGINSSDMTAIPFLSIGYSSPVSGSLENFIDIPQYNLHTDFSISASGESIYLYNNNLLVDSMQVVSLPSNMSYGRNRVYTNELQYFPEPTPEAANTTTGYNSLTGEVSFSVSGGIRYDSFKLSLSSDASSDHIYYTTDNTEPSTSSNLYNGPITIKSTTAVRAKIINDGGMPGPVSTESYLFYIKHDIPVISIVTDPDNFFGYENGIYVEGPGHSSSGENCDQGQNWWQNWERPVYVSMFDTNGNKAFGQNAGIKIFGGCSRNFAQKSLSIRFRKSYGKDGLDYKVFDDLNIDKFYSLNLRSSGNDWNQTMMKDAFGSKLFPEEIDKQAYQPSVVYINGEYWGIHNIRERFDEDYYATHYKLDPSSINIMEFHVNWLINLVEGDDQHYLDLLDFIEDNDLSLTENYEWVRDQMDVENFALYQASNICIKNTDWPGNNVKHWQSFEYDSLWRWMTYDLDFGLTDINHNTLTFAMADNNTGWPNPALSTYLLRMLNTNEDFRHLLINSFADVLNTRYQPEYYTPIFDEMKSTITSEIPAHMARWGGNASGWSSRTDGMKNFCSQRPGVVKNFVRNFYGIDGLFKLTADVSTPGGNIKVNSVNLKNYGYPWNGDYFNDVPVRLVAIPEKGFSFKKWTGNITSFQDTVYLTSKASASVTAVFEKDSSYEEIIVINEVFYKNIDISTPEDWVEIYNTGDNDVDVSGWVLKDEDDEHQFIIPSETVIQGKNYLVVCRNQRAVADYYGYVIPKTGDFQFGFSNEGDCVRLYNNKEILVDSLAYTNPFPDDDAAISYQRFVEDSEETWIITEDYGTPGKENVYLSTPVIPSAPSEIATISAYPNPFSNALNISFEVKSRTFVSIILLSHDGRYIEQIEDGTFDNGAYQVNWHGASKLPKGMYLVVLKTDEGIKTNKVIKL